MTILNIMQIHHRHLVIGPLTPLASQVDCPPSGYGKFRKSVDPSLFQPHNIRVQKIICCQLIQDLPNRANAGIWVATVLAIFLSVVVDNV
jgi:hypothetical protein